MKILHVFTIIGTPKAFFDGQFAFFAENGLVQHLVTADDEDVEFSQSNSLTYRKAEVARRIDIKADIRAIKDLSKYIRQEKFDVVVGHTPKGALVAMTASALSGTKHRVYYRHGLIYTTASGVKRFILKSVERFTSLLATKIVNVSPSLSKLAVKDHLNSNQKQQVIGLGTCGGIDTHERFNPSKVDPSTILSLRSQLGINENDFVLGFVGRICNDKGIPELLEAFELFRKKHPEIHSKLLLVGRFDTRDAVPELIKERILNDKDIISTGTIDQHLLPNYYSLMDVFVFPSHREGFGMTVIEASAMERPILVSRSHGCVDSIVPEKTGLYIGLTPYEILEGMEKMLDPSLRQRLGKAGREHAVENFDHQVLWPKFLNFYKNLNN